MGLLQTVQFLVLPTLCDCATVASCARTTDTVTKKKWQINKTSVLIKWYLIVIVSVIVIIIIIIIIYYYLLLFHGHFSKGKNYLLGTKGLGCML